MARKRQARKEQVRNAITSELTSLVDVLVSDEAHRILASLVEFHRAQQMFFEQFLDWVNRTPSDERRQILERQITDLGKRPGKVPIREEDLPGVTQALRGMTHTLLTGTVPEGQQTTAAVLLKNLMSQRPQRLKIKRAFLDAYLELLEAQRSGKVVTVESLTKRFMKYEFRRNPESAIRNMQRGIKRAKELHRLCKTLGIEFPQSISPGS